MKVNFITLKKNNLNYPFLTSLLLSSRTFVTHFASPGMLLGAPVGSISRVFTKAGKKGGEGYSVDSKGSACFELDSSIHKI